MTFNELFLRIGNSFGSFFNYLGNTPIEDLLVNLLLILFTIVICIIIVIVFNWAVPSFFGFVGSFLDKILPPKDKSKMPPLEKQVMYKMGKKLKKYLSK